jgi:hypothetical protein
MTIPGQTADTKISHPSTSDSVSQVAIDDSHSNHGTTHSCTGDSSIALDVFESPALPPADPAALASTEITRAALLNLGESPRDSSALATLWNENQLSIENEMQRHLHSNSNSNSPLLQQLLQGLVWHARFFCDEVDDPKAWVARSANLEARRMVLQLTKTR